MQFHDALRWASDWTLSYRQSVASHAVFPNIQPGDLRRALPAQGPNQGESYQTILADFQRLIPPAITHWGHPGFLNYFPCSTSEPGILAELLCAALNANGMLWRTSPAVTELEQVTLSWLRQWLGLPDQFGIIHDTASTASLHAMIAARHFVAPETRSTGLQGNLIIYTSEFAHSSIEKDAIAAGFGQQNVRKIPGDASYAMLPDALAATIRMDQQNGLTPCCVIGTVGTTSTTAIDPVPAIARITHDAGAWLHVDSAYAGILGIVPEYQHLLAGCELADSFVVNPHKWMMVPFDCSVLFTQRPNTFREAFSLVPAYLQTNEDSINFMDYGIPLGRRFRALKLWFVMRYFGLEGFQQHLRLHMHLAQQLGSRVDAHPLLTLEAPVSAGLVCFRVQGNEQAQHDLVTRINQSGDFHLGTTVVRNRTIIRVAFGSPGIDQATADRLWDAVQASLS